MTAKEKVLKVWPDTIVYGNKILWKWLWYRESDPDKISGKFDTEEAAWQDAAESMPSQPEQENGVSKFFGTWPGDETDKELLGALDEIRSPVAEPTPTPSTEPTKGHERANRIYQGRAGYEYSQRGEKYAIYCAGHCIAECEDAEVAEWICENWNKPQPDSSSIPNEVIAAEGKFDGFPFQIRKDISEEIIQAGTKSGAYLMLKFGDRDSSSISDELTLTRLRAAQLQERLDAVELKYAELVAGSSSISSEQTFEEWWSHTYPGMADSKEAIHRAFKEVANKAWNAAKGQSNGR